jgi:hypothetical protein
MITMGKCLCRAAELGIVLCACYFLWKTPSADTKGAPEAMEDDQWRDVEWRIETDRQISFENAERSVKRDDLPAAALAALQAIANPHPLASFEQERRDDLVCYEAEWVAADGKREATVTAEGVLLELERGVGDEEVPAGVRQLAEEVAGEAAVQYTRRDFVMYEIEYAAGGSESEVLLSPTGRKIGTEISQTTETRQ